MAKLVFNGENEKEIPQFGVFKPGDEVDFDESLKSTGLFSEKQEDTVTQSTEAGV